MTKITIALAASLLALAACSNMNATEQRTLSGASIGAVTGAVGTAIFHGNPIWGAVGGAAVGAAGGYVYDQYEKEKTVNYDAGYNAGKKSSSKPTNSNSGN